MEYDSAQEREMKAQFLKQVSAILKNQGRYEKTNGGLKVGFEWEYCLVKGGLDLVGVDLRDELLTEANTQLSVNGDVTIKKELGGAQLESNLGPINIRESGVEGLMSRSHNLENAVANILQTRGVSILRCGFYPRLPLLDGKIVRSSDIKYQVVPSYHDFNRGEHIDTNIGFLGVVHAAAAASLAFSNAVQFNIEASSLMDAVDKNNRSFMIAPFLLALGGNSRFIDFRDTGLSDVRMPIWEKSHDIRTEEEIRGGKLYRIGLPQNYHKNIEEYFDEVGSFPFILGPKHGVPLEAAFKVGIGLYWKDSRIKLPQEDACVVEFRILPIQPKMEEDLAFFFYYIGRLAYAQNKNEP